MRLYFSLKNIFIHALNALGTRQEQHSSLPSHPMHKTSKIAVNINTSLRDNFNRSTTTRFPPTENNLNSLQTRPSHFSKTFGDINPTHLLANFYRFKHSPEELEIAERRSKLRINNQTIINEDFHLTDFFQTLEDSAAFGYLSDLNHAKVKRETSALTMTPLPIDKSAAVPRSNQSASTLIIPTPSDFPYLNQALTKYESFLSTLLQQEQIRTGETAPAIEARIAYPVRHFLKQLIDTDFMSFHSHTPHNAYTQCFSALPISHERDMNGKVLPNLREYLYILYKMKKGEDATPNINPEEIATNMLALVASMRINSIPEIRDQERAALFASTDGMRDYYSQQALDLYLGQQALALDQHLDWEKVAIRIRTPAQAFAATFAMLSERDQAEYKYAINSLGWRFTKAFSENQPLLSILATYSKEEREIFTQALLIYQKAKYPHQTIKGEDLLSLQNSFANTLTKEYQKAQIFRAASASSPPTTLNQAQSVFFGDITLKNAQGKNLNDLLNEPSLQTILGFKKYPKAIQAALLIERLVEKGESPDARYPIGSFFHSVSSVLMRIEQMQNQFRYHFVTPAELIKKFIEIVNTWQTAHHLPIDPRVLLGLHLAGSSNEQIIDTSSSLEKKLQALNTYIQERWSAHMGTAPRPFNRRQEALHILLQQTGHSRHRIENHVQIFSETLTGAITNEYRMTLLNYFLKQADNNKPLNLGQKKLNPHQLLERAEENYNEKLQTHSWIVNRAKENLREKGIALTSIDTLNHEIKQLAKTYSTQTEEERDRQRLLHVSEQVPLLGSFVSLIEGITTHNQDEIIGSIPIIGSAYNLEEGIRTHNRERALGALPIIGSGQNLVQNMHNGDDIGIYMSALGMAIDIESSGSNIVHTIAQKASRVASRVRHINEHQLPDHLRLSIEHTAAAGEALGLPLRSIRLPATVEHTLTPREHSIQQNSAFHLKDILSITKEAPPSALKQRLQKFADTNPQFQKNGWAQIVDTELEGGSEIFVLTHLAQTDDLILLKERISGRYEMFDLETGQAKRNGVGIYKTVIDDKVEFYRGGLLGGGNIDWKKTYPRFAFDLANWLLESVSGEERLQVYHHIDRWMSYSTVDRPLELNGYGLSNLPPLPPTVRILDISNNRLTNLAGLPPDLENLRVENNFLTHLPSTLPEKLRTLNVSFNRLTAAPEELPLNLKGLHLACNLLNELPNLPDTLEIIDITGNRITALPDPLPLQLKILDASDNRITALPVSWPTELSIVRLDSNALISISSLPTQLKILSLAHNQNLHNWPPRWPVTLKELRLAHCGFTTVRNMPRLPKGLEKLDFSVNQFSTLPNYLPEHLRELLFSDNTITSLPALPGQLVELKAAKNRIHTWPQHLPSTLIEIDLQENNLSGTLPNNLPPGLHILNVENNRLTTLPHSLPIALRWLKVTGNQLSTLPSLPENLIALFANNNRLTTLPQLPHNIITILINDNRLSHLPESLPANLRRLHAANNQLTILPENIPHHLQHLNIENNQISSLPEMPLDISILNLNNNRLTSLPRSLLRRGPRHVIHAENNPFSHQFLQSIESISRVHRTRLHLSRPIDHIHLEYASLSLRQEAEAASARPITEAISAWYNERERAQIENIWDQWKTEAKSSSFSKFIDNLVNTKAAKHKEFKNQVRNLLTQASQDNELRKMLFTIAEEGLGTCSDRTALTYNRMTMAKIEIDAMRGAYDNALSVMLPLARQMFRLDKLIEIAAQKITQNPLLDDVEIYLEYQLKLREKLQLYFLPIKEMRYNSGLQDHYFIEAEHQIKQAENQQFVTYLATEWQPWQAVLQRLDLTAYNQAKEQISNLSEHFEQALSDYLIQNKLANSEQMRAEHGPQVANQMRNTVYIQLTERFIEKQNLNDLLKPFWNEIDDNPHTSPT